MLEECSSFFPVGAGWLIDGVWFLMFFFPRYTLGLLLIVAMCLHADQNLAAPNLTLGSPMAIDLYWKKKYLCTAQLPVHMPVLGPFKGSLNNVEQDNTWILNFQSIWNVWSWAPQPMNFPGKKESSARQWQVRSTGHLKSFSLDLWGAPLPRSLTWPPWKKIANWVVKSNLAPGIYDMLNLRGC